MRGERRDVTARTALTTRHEATRRPRPPAGRMGCNKDRDEGTRAETPRGLALTRAITPEMNTVGFGGLQDKGKGGQQGDSRQGTAAGTRRGRGGAGNGQGRRRQREADLFLWVPASRATRPGALRTPWSPPPGGEFRPRGSGAIGRRRQQASWGEHLLVVLGFVLRPEPGESRHGRLRERKSGATLGELGDQPRGSPCSCSRQLRTHKLPEPRLPAPTAPPAVKGQVPGKVPSRLNTVRHPERATRRQSWGDG